MTDSNQAMFDEHERAILSELVAEADMAETGDADLPDESTDTPAVADMPPANTHAVDATASAEPVNPPASAEPAPPQGDTRAALRASRRAEKRLRDELERMRDENEALKQGKGQVDTSISDEELALLDVDFPLQAKIVRKQRELEQQLSKATATAQPAMESEFEPLSYKPEVQEVIDGVPDLVAWQYDPAAQDKFLRAIDYDKALSVDPDWKDRDVTERFTEAARRAKAALEKSPTPLTPAALAAAAVTAATRQDPAAVIANAKVETPKGISDFRGGATATQPTVNYENMTDEQIMASLPVR